MYFSRQLVATDGNGFLLVSAFSSADHLPPAATGCNHGAP
jgi:hypothetical protein